MADWQIADVLKALLKKARYSGTMLALGAVLIFAPSNFLDKFSLTEFRAKYRIWIGPATFVLAGVWVVQICSIAMSWWNRCRAWNRRRQLIPTMLRELSEGERAILVNCLGTGSTTFYASLVDSAAHALDAKGLANRAAGGGNITRWPHVIVPDVWKYINKHPLSLATAEEMEELRRRQITLPSVRA
jgi:hypothetical protein